MHPSDEANWRAIDAGRSPVWSDLLGHSDAAHHLSERGRDLLPRIAGDLDSFFGPDWLAKARPNGSPTTAFAGLVRQSPAFSMYGDVGAAGSFFEFLRWWAAIQTQRTSRNIAQVRKDLRRDVTLPRLLHSLTLMRLGATAQAHGIDVKYEPTPGDLLLTRADVSVTVEVFAMRTSKDITDQMGVSEQMHQLLRLLELEHSVHAHGSLPPVNIDLEKWISRTTQAAASAARGHLAVSVIVDDCELVIEPGGAPKGTSLDGPTIGGDVGQRIQDRLRTKAEQVADAATAWLWVENHGAIDMLSHVHYLPLNEQTEAFHNLMLPALNPYANIAGATFSGAGRRRFPPPPRVEARYRDARGLQQPLMSDRVRTSIHVPTAPDAVSDLMWELVTGEFDWLPWALSSLGIVGSPIELLSQHVRELLRDAI